MEKKHPNLSDDINNNIAQSERDGGVWLKDVAVGDTIMVQTKNRVYTIVKVSDESYLIEGHPEYCAVQTPARIHGSTWGGSMLKMGYIGRGMHLEFSTQRDRLITTSVISDVMVYRKEG